MNTKANNNEKDDDVMEFMTMVHSTDLLLSDTKPQAKIVEKGHVIKS